MTSQFFFVNENIKICRIERRLLFVFLLFKFVWISLLLQTKAEKHEVKQTSMLLLLLLFLLQTKHLHYFAKLAKIVKKKMCSNWNEFQRFRKKKVINEWTKSFSQNFLRRFLTFFLTLGLKILRKSSFLKDLPLKVDVNYCKNHKLFIFYE